MSTRSRSRRVVVVIPSTQRRGAELQGIALGAGLATRGWEVSVIAVEPGRGGELLDIPALGSSRRSLAGLLRLRRMARNAVVISHGSSSLLAVALATAASSTRWVYRNIGDPAAWVPTRWARMRTGWFMRRASAFAVLWPGAASSIQSLYRTGGTPMTVIPNDRDPQRFTAVSDEERRAAREALALEGNVVLILGSLTAEKQPLTAVEAVSRIAGATLLVVGDGPLATEVRELGERLAPGRVRMLGVRGDPELAIAASDVLLLPSRTEGMPGVIIESMMRGVPVVATAVGAVLSMIDEGSTGCVVGVGDVEAMVRALQTVLTGDPARFRSVCRMRAVRDYSPQAVLDSWDELLGGLSAG